MNRPVGVSIIVVLIVISAVADLMLGFWMMLAPILGNPTLTDHLGNSQEISGFFLFVNGALSFILGLMYFWLAKLTLIGSATARILIIMLSAINLFFALFRLPFGWGIILVSIVILLMVNTKAAKDYFTQTA